MDQEIACKEVVFKDGVDVHNAIRKFKMKFGVMVSAKEAAWMLCIHDVTLRRLVAKKAIPYTKIHHYNCFSYENLMDYLKQKFPKLKDQSTRLNFVEDIINRFKVIEIQMFGVVPDYEWKYQDFRKLFDEQLQWKLSHKKSFNK